MLIQDSVQNGTYFKTKLHGTSCMKAVGETNDFSVTGL